MIPINFFTILGVIVFLTIFGSFFLVQEKTAKIVTRLGRFVRIGRPGLNFKLPFIEGIAGVVNLRIQQLDVKVETKTSDNVFVHVKVSVQFHVLGNKIFDAFYKLDNPDTQIESYVFDVIRARVPLLKLDHVFENKDDLAIAVKEGLDEAMDEYGYNIVKALVTDIDPDEKVKRAMNEINAAQRQRVAAEEKGEAERILKVKAAQAEAESKKLQGRGIADQRKAIIDGLRNSMSDLKEAMDGATSQEAMLLILLTQYFDMLKELGAESQVNTVMLPHSPGGLNDLTQQIISAMAVGQNLTYGAGGGAGSRRARSDDAESEQWDDD
jgi:regulator of protease activity HflC (stomatin/prohibitin superfamily)